MPSDFVGFLHYIITPFKNQYPAKIKREGTQTLPYSKYGATLWQRSFYDHVIRDEEI